MDTRVRAAQEVEGEVNRLSNCKHHLLSYAGGENECNTLSPFVMFGGLALGLFCLERQQVLL